MSNFYEIWVKPERGINGGPLTVQERGFDGATLSWLDKEEAIKIAKEKHRIFPTIHFVVRSEDINTREAAIVYDTSKDTDAGT